MGLYVGHDFLTNKLLVLLFNIKNLSILLYKLNCGCKKYLIVFINSCSKSSCFGFISDIVL